MFLRVFLRIFDVFWVNCKSDYKIWEKGRAKTEVVPVFLPRQLLFL